MRKFIDLIKNAALGASAPSTLTSKTTFASLGLDSTLCDAVAAAGYESPTPIQAQAIPPVIEGRDLLACAQTGTGKTAAFALPILHRLVKNPGRGIRALILAPTRELAIQIGESFETYSRGQSIRTAVVYGGVGLEPQVQKIRRGIDVLVATPGRLIDIAGRGVVDVRNLEVFVLDEADRMLDMGFIHDVKRIIAQLPKQRQNLLLSATIPKEVEALIAQILRDPARVEVTPVSSTTELVEQKIFFVDRANKRHLLLHLVQNRGVTRGLVFTRTKSTANRVAEFLTKAGVPAAAIHGNKSQGARQRALGDFRSGKVPVLVASDIAARGIDIDEVSHVINYDLPNVPETYVHRIGRTGRAMATGDAWSLVDASERPWLRDIEKVIKRKIPVQDDHPFPAGSVPDDPTPPQMGRSSGRRGGRRGHSQHGGGASQGGVSQGRGGQQRRSQGGSRGGSQSSQRGSGGRGRGGSGRQG